MNTQCFVKLMVRPLRGLFDEKVSILVQKFLPGSKLTIHASHQCEDKYNWEAFGHYYSDATGTVNVSQDSSLGGTYTGVEPTGLLWSLKPVPGSKPGLRMRKKDVQIPMEITISVYQGHLTEGFVDQPTLASALVERWYMAPGVRKIAITDNGINATLFMPPGPGPFPGILDLFGAGGQLFEYRSALLASHGFASMTMDYLTPKNTSETGEPGDDQMLEAAYRILQQHPQVREDRIGMVGLSLGGCLMLHLAVDSKVIKPKCAVCIGGSHVQPIGGRPKDLLKFLIISAPKVVQTERNERITRGIFLPIPTDPAAKVDMGLLQCPLLLVVGEDDQNTAAHESAMDMKARMDEAGNSHLLTILSYPKAGHLIEPPYTPFTRVSSFKVAQTNQIRMSLWGGEMAAHCQAQEDTWKKTLVFLQENLCNNERSRL